MGDGRSCWSLCSRGQAARAIVSAQGAGAEPTVGTQEVYSTTVRYSRGQSIQPVFEGWSRNPDGSFDMWFGYLNRNYEERLNIAVGPDNGFNGEDMGQPEFFETRRQQFAFKVNVPATFPEGSAISSGRSRPTASR